MVGIGGLIGSLIVVSYVLQYNSILQISVLIILAGLIATSRLYLEAHKPKQIYSGFFLGLLTQIGVFLGFLFFNFN